MENPIEKRRKTPLEALCEQYLSGSQIRHERLFYEFLPTGYRQTMLSSVDPDLIEKTVMAKMHLGMLITLIDDLADNPEHFDLGMAESIYSMVFTKEYKRSSHPTMSLAVQLAEGLDSHLAELPHGTQLSKIIEFDLQQVLMANRYSSLISQFKGIANPVESRFYGPFNMGMMAAGMIDLASSPEISLEHLSVARELFWKGQRVGRIGNLLATYTREVSEGDETNEILIEQKSAGRSASQLKKGLHIEVQNTLREMERERRPCGFSVVEYANGLRQFFQLHLQLEGVI